MEKVAIWFDMDGTIADLYGVENWLEKLVNSDPSPYEEAAPLLNLSSLARVLNRLQRQGYKIGIVSWLSKSGSAEYNEAVIEAKQGWLKAHLKSVHFDYIDIIKHSTPKEIGRNGILFDDEEKNRKNWSGAAFDQTQIMEILKSL